MSRADVGAEGKTGYERRKERRARLLRMEFGEAVLWKRRREGGTARKFVMHVGGWDLLGREGG